MLMTDVAGIPLKGDDDKRQRIGFRGALLWRAEYSQPRRFHLCPPARDTFLNPDFVQRICTHSPRQLTAL